MEATPHHPHGFAPNYINTSRQRGSVSTIQQQQVDPLQQKPQQHAAFSFRHSQQPSRQQRHNHAYPAPGYRLGGIESYRDDSDTPFDLECLTRGGMGPPRSMPCKDISKSLPLPRRILSCYRGSACWHASRNSPVDSTLYYQDDFNELSWSCSFGTTDDHGVWLNRLDPAGTLMSCLVWFLVGYSAITTTFLAQTGGIPSIYAFLYGILATLALACHAKTSLTDPGAVPASAVPTEQQRHAGSKLSMCSQCQTFKPPMSHHCRICNRCISRMDHHCPWMNNCVGAGNMKHFCLFLLYTWACSVSCLLLLGWNYFFCASENCTFTTVLVQLVRIMTLLSVGAFLFTSSMLMNVCYGLMTGIGTIDRLKKKAQGQMEDSDEEQIPLKDVFGIGPVWTWLFPTDPIFEDYDCLMGYSTPQRLLREQLKSNGTTNSTSMTGWNGDAGSSTDTPSVASRDSYGIPVEWKSGDLAKAYLCR